MSDDLKDYMRDELTKEELAEAMKLIGDNIVGKGPEDFTMFNAREQHFLFSMRTRASIKPSDIYISKKQFNYLKDLMARMADPDLNRVSKIAYLKRCIPQSKREVTHLKKQLKEAEALLAEQEEELAAVSIIGKTDKPKKG